MVLFVLTPHQVLSAAKKRCYCKNQELRQNSSLSSMLMASFARSSLLEVLLSWSTAILKCWSISSPEYAEFILSTDSKALGCFSNAAVHTLIICRSFWLLKGSSCLTSTLLTTFIHLWIFPVLQVEVEPKEDLLLMVFQNFKWLQLTTICTSPRWISRSVFDNLSSL